MHKKVPLRIKVVGQMKLFDFLLQAGKQIRVEELVDCNTETIAQFLYCGYGCTVVPAANDVVYGGLRNTTNATKFVN